MDLNQRKLTKAEWESIEAPVSPEEKEILLLIIQGYHNVNIKTNKYNSLFSFLKISYGEQMEDHLYNKYFSKKIQDLNTLYPNPCFAIDVNAKPMVKKADLIRIEQNDMSKMSPDIVYEFLLLEIIEKMLKLKKKKNGDWVLQYFTLYKLCQNNIPLLNRHILTICRQLNTLFEPEMDMSKIIGSSVSLIEKNGLLLKYADMVLYEHQKQLFTVMRSNKPKLALYIAPTGTGKTLSPIGLSEHKRVIFVCAARHVGLALARAAISVDKKIAFAFGCASSGDIRLHYFAAKEYSKNRKSGGIWKVDNSIGDKVEIMICDVKSYIPAMFYMTAFNEANDIITYWDEPTITMDYDAHELHHQIKQNWCENVIPNVILSSATLPKLHELTDTIADFKDRFSTDEIHNVVSHDCKKSIPIINKHGHIVLPHYLSDNYGEILEIVEHCEQNLTLMRYFDLAEVIAFVEFAEKSDYIKNSAKIERHFTTLNDITMQNIKLHYLRVLKSIKEDVWPVLFQAMNAAKKRRIMPNDLIDAKGNPMRKAASVGPGISAAPTIASTVFSGAPIIRQMSEQILPPTEKKAPEENCAIYITTKDAYTLTDGPTIFLATDIEKIARFCIQQANIPAKVMDDIMGKLEFNNKLNEQIKILEHLMEDNIERNSMKDSNADEGKAITKKTSNKEPNENNVELSNINHKLDTMRALIKTADLNETFVPNKELHLKRWVSTTIDSKRAFTSDIADDIVIDIMMLNDVNDSWKILLLMGIGVFTSHTSIAYTEIMKKLADQQKLYMIIASSDYIYGTNYQFCHGYLSKDLELTQEKIIQALGRIGRNNIQQDYSVRLRDDDQIRLLFFRDDNKPEVKNMNKLFNRRVALEVL